jgi:hypothetical protein
MTSTEFHEWMAFYELEHEDEQDALDKAKAEAKAEADKHK